MKKLIGFVFIGLCLVMGYLFFFQGEETVEIPLTSVEVEKRVINIGNNPMNQPSFAYFNLLNTGSNELVIKDITSDCHCTAITSTINKASPGESLLIKAEYDNNSTGFFNQAITVHLNTLSSPELLIIRGRIIE